MDPNRYHTDAFPGNGKRLLLLILFFVSVHGYICAQQTSKQCRDFVLDQNIPDSTYVFDRSYPPDNDIIYITYLGSLVTESGDTLKVLNSNWVWGETEDLRETPRTLIYTGNNEFLGDYNWNLSKRLPHKLKKGVLRFEQNLDNGKTGKVKVDLTKGYPKCIIGPDNVKICFVKV